MSDKMQPDREKSLSIEKDSQINVVVNRQGDSDEIDLLRIFQNIKKKGHVFVWVLILCLVVGLCAPLLMYQFKKKSSSAVSVVTLVYDVTNSSGSKSPVKTLTAPDGTSLDLTQITSSYVLQNALKDLVLSEDISLPQLRNNIKIERILTENSRREQEVASRMLSDKNSKAYEQIESVKLTYANQFLVTLNNGFTSSAETESRKIVLPVNELRLLLDRVLAAYNDYLVMTYADFKLPSDEISIIDIENLDIMASLDLLHNAIQNLYDYCYSQSDKVKAYRSWRDGRSLSDLMKTLETVRDIHVDYLYSYVYSNSITLDRENMLNQYRYQLRETQTKLDIANENIATTAEILKSYKHDQIYLENQENNSAKSTRITTDYYNNLFLQQAMNYATVNSLQISIDDLNEKIENLLSDTMEINAEASADELADAIRVCKSVYNSIYAQMEEIMSASFYTTFADASAAQSESENFLFVNIKKMALGAAAGAVVGCGLWFAVAFAEELKRGRKYPDDEEVAQ